MGAVEEQRSSKSANPAPVQGYWGLISRAIVTSADFEAAKSLVYPKRVGTCARKRYLGLNNNIEVHRTARRSDNSDSFSFQETSSSTPKDFRIVRNNPCCTQQFWMRFML